MPAGFAMDSNSNLHLIFRQFKGRLTDMRYRAGSKRHPHAATLTIHLVAESRDLLQRSAAFGSGIDWQTSAGPDRYRRALYTTWRRSNPYPSMATFDAPNREVCTVRRVRTNTPLQALVTLNDPVYVEAAQALARKIVAEGGATTRDRLVFAFRTCTSRPPRDDELARLSGLYEQTLAKLQPQAEQARKLATEPLGPAPPGTNVAELATWTMVGNVLLNLDEMLMKR